MFKFDCTIEKVKVINWFHFFRILFEIMAFLLKIFPFFIRFIHDEYSWYCLEWNQTMLVWSSLYFTFKRTFLETHSPSKKYVFLFFTMIERSKLILNEKKNYFDIILCKDSLIFFTAGLFFQFRSYTIIN